MFDAEWNNAELREKLKELLQPGPERGGFILPTGEIIELQNSSENPDENFRGFNEDLDLNILDTAVATWHTHPDATANLSSDDAGTFLAWSDLLHFIVGTDGVRAYRAKGLGIVNA